MPFKSTLTNHGYMGLGLYVGFKSTHRRSEMESFGVNYDQVVEELTRVGLIRNGRMDLAEGRRAWRERFCDILPSQTHQYEAELGYTRIGW
jgi:hypothetical protein